MYYIFNNKQQYYKNKTSNKILSLLSDASYEDDEDKMIIYKQVLPLRNNIYIYRKDEFIKENILLTDEQLDNEINKRIEEKDDNNYDNNK